MLKAGRKAKDPLNRIVTILEKLPNGDFKVRLAGSYGATIRYPASCLTAVDENEEDGGYWLRKK